MLEEKGPEIFQGQNLLDLCLSRRRGLVVGTAVLTGLLVPSWLARAQEDDSIEITESTDDDVDVAGVTAQPEATPTPVPSPTPRSTETPTVEPTPQGPRWETTYVNIDPANLAGGLDAIL